MNKITFFKVGDWVVFNNLYHSIDSKFKQEIYKPFKIVKIDSSGNCYGKKTGEFAGSDYIDLWRPEKNEKCVFFNKEDGIKVVSLFYNFEHNGFTEGIEFKNYKYCEPAFALCCD